MHAIARSGCERSRSCRLPSRAHRCRRKRRQRHRPRIRRRRAPPPTSRAIASSQRRAKKTRPLPAPPLAAPNDARSSGDGRRSPSSAVRRTQDPRCPSRRRTGACAWRIRPVTPRSPRRARQRRARILSTTAVTTTAASSSRVRRIGSSLVVPYLDVTRMAGPSDPRSASGDACTRRRRVSPNHTWWGLTYDVERERLLWMAARSPMPGARSRMQSRRTR